MSTEKIVGYSLLGVGILLMIIASFQIILVFTGKATPIQVMKSAPQKNNQNTTKNVDTTNPDELLKQAQQDPFSLLGSGGGLGMPDIIDPKTINDMLNLTVYYFIMQFVLGLGYKLASLGVQMVRPLKISVEKSAISHLIKDGESNTS
ncbi:hypothetical protein CO051_04505 [Candidatus Roizmanbacteria bacterium CG_4_9_14_0_2_um_filter_39_13]|uniref:Uncharacterized protein n=2 Tax=Candidatus Roizmaniibacteriota TaxID=1752723 RepID=A0A2M8EXY3_9BACT|nr:MAG: hypothetical protein COY15_01870 [Candidatus Roizmanbacteria bacterium CG_4_10_14_0_2_um_filter_39_12]PJC31059.1 MAG: hypothetical protein CO051_04505 [Candidatus Roizmanbacteria bacterium CG_4_9_14_0_2_um_filter_39_13]PJE61881.1 MAG: hypothetical protein COU87_02245 [Candidatus Roizmanbacteria bacterium CG10_big_fil_rev_8_21_14_0_10_39_12]